MHRQETEQISKASKAMAAVGMHNKAENKDVTKNTMKRHK